MRSLSLPTTRSDWRRMGWATRRVLAHPPWLCLAVVTAVASVVLFVAADRPVYIRTVVLGGGLSLWGRLDAVLTLLPAPVPGPGFLRSVLLYLTGVAVGTNLALIGYQLRHTGTATRGSTGGALAIGLGVLGAGCASCGIAVVASALSLTGVAAGLGALPLDGVEFLLLAVAATTVSIHWAAAGVAAGTIDGCPVEP